MTVEMVRNMLIALESDLVEAENQRIELNAAILRLQGGITALKSVIDEWENPDGKILSD